MATTPKAGIQASITAGIRTGSSDTTAAELRAILNEILDSYPNVIDDKNANNGYLGIDGTGKVDVSFIKKTTATGDFLRDDGTWKPVVTNQTLAQTLANGNTSGANDIIAEQEINMPNEQLGAMLYIDSSGNIKSTLIQSNNVELKSNKATTMTGNTTSNILFLTAKAIFDWATGLFAPINSPTFTGVPAAPTAALNTSTTQLATTAFVKLNQKATQVSGYGTLLNPARNVTYYFGQFNVLISAQTSIGNANRGTILVTGNITTINVAWWINSTYSTAEGVTLNFRNLTKSTSHTVISNLQFTSGAAPFNNIATNIAVDANDRYTFEFICPNWVTVPVGLIINTQMIIS